MFRKVHDELIMLPILDCAPEVSHSPQLAHKIEIGRLIESQANTKLIYTIVREDKMKLFSLFAMLQLLIFKSSEL